MGQLFSKSTQIREIQIIMVGLSGAGKTTILKKAKYGTLDTPSIPANPAEYNVETVNHQNVSYVIWDVSGANGATRSYWRSHLREMKALVYVVDAADPTIFADARRELHWILADEDLRHMVLLIVANKQDLPTAVSTVELIDKLGLTNQRNREWYIQGTSRDESDGFRKGLEWIIERIRYRAALASKGTVIK